MLDKMNKHCPVTGEINCKCGKKQLKVPSLRVDLKSSLRKLFTDHAVYTKFVINSIVDNTNDLTVVLNRLLENQKDIGNQIRDIIGNESANELIRLLTIHIKLAGEVIKASKMKESHKLLQSKVNILFENGDQIADLLNSLNEEKLPYETVRDMFHIHNQFIIDMTIERLHGNYLNEQRSYDAYYNEILEMSDAISNAL